MATNLTLAEEDYYGMVYKPYKRMMDEVVPQLGEMMGYYKPGGGYGTGRRLEAEEAVRGGMARDIGQMVSTGMSSQFGARGTGMRAGAELSKLYKNIEDTRSQLWQQSVQPYAQILSQMAGIFQARPGSRAGSGVSSTSRTYQQPVSKPQPASKPFGYYSPFW